MPDRVRQVIQHSYVVSHVAVDCDVRGRALLEVPPEDGRCVSEGPAPDEGLCQILDPRVSGEHVLGPGGQGHRVEPLEAPELQHDRVPKRRPLVEGDDAPVRDHLGHVALVRRPGAPERSSLAVDDEGPPRQCPVEGVELLVGKGLDGRDRLAQGGIERYGERLLPLAILHGPPHGGLQGFKLLRGQPLEALDVRLRREVRPRGASPSLALAALIGVDLAALHAGAVSSPSRGGRQGAGRTRPNPASSKVGEPPHVVLPPVATSSISLS